jgi:hypothetical protein
MVIETEDGGSADMGGVYQVENCVQVFQACWLRLFRKSKQAINPDHSLLIYIVDAQRLENKRRECTLKASLIQNIHKQTAWRPANSNTNANTYANKPVNSTNSGYNRPKQPQPNNPKQPQPNGNKQPRKSSKKKRKSIFTSEKRKVVVRQRPARESQI